MALNPLLNEFFFTASKSSLINLFFIFFKVEVKPIGHVGGRSAHAILKLKTYQCLISLTKMSQVFFFLCNLITSIFKVLSCLD